MSKISVTFKMDKNLKFDLENFCDSLGMSLSTFFSVIAKKTLREKRLELDLSEDDPFYSKENMAELKRRVTEMKAGINVSEHELIEVD